MIHLDVSPHVWGIVGNLGGGKTLSAVGLAVTALRDGYAVVSNVTLDIPLICREFKSPWIRRLYTHISLDDPNFDPFLVPCGSPRGSGGGKRVVVILDEVAEWVDQYTRAQDPKIKRLWSWLRHSSKRSQDVIIICQRQEYINKVVRTLISRWLWVDDLRTYRLPKIKLKFPFCSNLVMSNLFDRQGSKIGGPYFGKKTYWGRFYNTAECLNSDGASVYNSYYVPPVKYKLNRLTMLLFFISLLLLVRAAHAARRPRFSEGVRGLGYMCIPKQELIACRSMPAL